MPRRCANFSSGQGISIDLTLPRTLTHLLPSCSITFQVVVVDVVVVVLKMTFAAGTYHRVRRCAYPGIHAVQGCGKHLHLCNCMVLPAGLRPIRSKAVGDVAGNGKRETGNTSPTPALRAGAHCPLPTAYLHSSTVLQQDGSDSDTMFTAGLRYPSNVGARRKAAARSNISFASSMSQLPQRRPCISSAFEHAVSSPKPERHATKPCGVRS